MPLIFAMNGCAAIQVKLGMKVYLAKIPVNSIEVRQAKDPGIGPGQKSSLIVEVTKPVGKVLQTEGAGKGKVMWRDLVVTPTIVTVNNKGVLTLAKDPRKSDGKFPTVTITAPSHPDLHAQLDVPLRYNYKFVSNFSGTPGFDGMNGSDGTTGSSGSMGSTDPNNPSAGGDGGNGGPGGDGGPGGNGGDAPSVQVQVTLRTGSHPLLQAGVFAPGHKRYYLVDPQGGTLTVKADGGKGGSGGKGGNGGQGGSGGSGSPSGNNGSSGTSGINGPDGSPGRGGLITVTYDPKVKPYLANLIFSSWNGPKPVLEEAPVVPLW
ncbi:MAG: hypothetical protein WAN35_19385 [Terracidiphilus sp.]